MKSSNSCVTSLLITLNLLTVSLAESNHTESQAQINNVTTEAVSTSTTATTSEGNFLEASNFNEMSTTSSPEISADSDSINGFEIILYIFAVIGVTLSTICLIQIIRTSSYCDRGNQENHSMSNRERNLSWKRSWRGNNRNYAFPDHMIAV